MPTLPNLSTSFASLQLDGTPIHGKRWTSQRERRSHIFASTRKLMESQDLSTIHLQDVAVDCDLAIQTIYNLVGNRFELITGSIVEWGSAISQIARVQSLETGSDSILTTMAMHWQSAISCPSYVYNTAQSTHESAIFRRRLCDLGTKVVAMDLAKTYREGGLRDRVDAGSLARHLALTAHLTICDWAVEKYDIQLFRKQLLQGPGGLLIGAFTGEALKRLERTMANFAL